MRIYSKEQKTKALSEYWKIKDVVPEYSIREHAGRIGVHYYTCRDWYRGPAYNPRFNRRHEYCSSSGFASEAVNPFNPTSFVVVKG